MNDRVSAGDRSRRAAWTRVSDAAHPSVRLASSVRTSGSSGRPYVSRNELGELADGPQLRDGHRRLPSAGEDDREPIRSSGHDLPHDEPHVGDLVGQVEVVEDEGGSFGRDRWQFGDEGSDRVIAGRPAGFE